MILITTILPFINSMYAEPNELHEVELQDPAAYVAYVESDLVKELEFDGTKYLFVPAGGTWELIPQGDVDKFTIMLNTGVNDDELIWEEVGASGISGAIRSKEDESTFGTTKVLFTIVPKNRTVEGAEAARIWFKTYVYDGPNKTGTKYSLDSETQLYDTRGYHYFQTYNPTH